jgi:hypothetical protein
MGRVLSAIVESRDGKVETRYQGGMGTPFSTEALAAPPRTEAILADWYEELGRALRMTWCPKTKLPDRISRGKVQMVH